MKKSVLRIITVFAILSILFTLMVVPASAVTINNKDIYLKLYNIDGESKDSKHDKWIDVIYFSHGSMQSDQTISPDSANASSFAPVVFKHVVDKATPLLHDACMKGSHIKNAELHFCRAIAGKQVVTYKVKFDLVKLVKVEVETEDLSDGTCRLVETVTFVAEKQTWTQTAVGIDNNISGDTEANYNQSKKASMFDSNTNITVVIGSAAVFVLIVIAVLFFAIKKKKAVAKASADVSVNEKAES